jgi:ElaB/YqjD/DUF883 family membrane-anchored ribosome-binding protein
MNEHKSVNQLVESLSTHISEGVHAFIKDAGPALQHARDSVSDQFSDLKQQGVQAVSKASHDVERVGHDMKNRAACMIRDKPLKAVVIAAGVGALTAAIVGWVSRQRS